MSDENLELENQSVAPEAEDKSAEEKKKAIPEEDVQKIVRERLKQQRREFDQREAEYQAKIRDLENAPSAQAASAIATAPMQHGASVAPPAQPAAPMQAAPQHADAQNNSDQIPVEMLPHILDRQRRDMEFRNKIDDAASKDDEFKELISNSKTGEIPGALLPAMYHLDNSPAVVKHLLKDPKDYQLMMAAAREGEYRFIEFLNNLSNRIDGMASKPSPSKFTPAKDLSDVGDSDQDFDIESYVKGKA